MDKIIVNFTPTGIIPTKKETPHVPITPEEIISQVREAYELGITMVHLHARDENQVPSHKKEVYEKIIKGIRVYAPELVICVSTSGRVFNRFDARSEVLDLEGNEKPDMASLTLSSLNFNASASVNDPEMIRSLALRMMEKGIKPELEIFDLGMVNYMNYLIKKELLQPPYYANLILGNIACAQPDLLHIGCIIKDLPKETYFSLGAVGDAQLQMNALSVSMGWGVRVGIEDNYWLDASRTVKATNISLLSRIKNIVDANQKEIMTSKELRKILGLKQGYGQYGL